MAEAEIKNKVANSKLITLSLEDFYPAGPRREIDLVSWLYEGVMLREKEFRQHVKDHDWEQYRDAYVAVYCSEDAIIPQWAYMLVASKLAGIARYSVYGSLESLEAMLITERLNETDFSKYRDERIILKGCGHLPIPPQAYHHFVTCLQPFAKSIMYGEACSTVPVYKRKKQA